MLRVPSSINIMGQLCDLFYPSMALRHCMTAWRKDAFCLTDHAMEDNGLPIYNYPSSIVYSSNILMRYVVTLLAYVQWYACLFLNIDIDLKGLACTFHSRNADGKPDEYFAFIFFLSLIHTERFKSVLWNSIFYRVWVFDSSPTP